MKYVFTILIIIVINCTLTAQSLSGIWEGTYTHFVPNCCGEENYNCRYVIYEDSRGALWIESTRSPVLDEHSVGEIFAGGYRMNDGRIIFRDVKETFSSNRFVSSCFKSCTWCMREVSVKYSKQGKTETLTGLWNSHTCHPGGEITLKKVGDLPPRENIRLMKLGRAEDKGDKGFGFSSGNDFDPNRLYMAPYPIYADTSKPNTIWLWFAKEKFHITVDDISSLDEKHLEKYFIIQNATMKLDERNYQNIIYFELKDIRNGKVYPLNPYNIPPNEIRNFPISGSKLTFPNRREWEEILSKKRNSTDNGTVNPNERKIKIRQQTITINRLQPVTIKLWDNNLEDGDIISIFINGELVLKSYTLKKDKKEIANLAAKLKKGKNTIVMYAENLGTTPPNTASISVHSGDELIRTFSMESDMGTSEAFEIILE